MKLKEQIANFFTLMNLVCGVIAIICIMRGALTLAGVLVFLGAFFDFIDGFVARALRISSELGKQLDSLSDLVTFGVVPGLLAHEMMVSEQYSFVVLLIPVFSALRLGKFNIDTRQSKNFIGLPTPANGLFWASLAIIFYDIDALRGLLGNKGEANDFYTSLYKLLTSDTFIYPAVVVASLLMVAPLRLIGLKFSNMALKGNEMRIALIAISIVLAAFIGFYAAPIILLLYIVFSIIHFYILKRDETNTIEKLNER